jgi:lysylphosphatidylglycerol synthetase-like protein (DUF2156 family)
MSTVRPIGVTILAILEILGGLVELGIGGLLLVAAGFIGGIASQVPEVPNLPGIGGLIAGIILFIGIVVVILGVLALIIAWGLWTGQGWAWTLALILAIVSLIFSILSLPGGIIGLLIDILILYYLTRPHVKAFFGKGPPTTAPPPPPA